ncbi:DsrE/DsrF/DrsH-like family protein [Sulfobacillus thermosulfidooxidans]|uniref:Sulfur reduction protein DsrE n=1 Tax=Sulfobacillus thermosulfidooxidans TaxID=28034 RepID=A0A1R0IVF7_SULTH|nr:DsrE/DsrF/DrsH-like family protein [Sulfobacillus thermosulfidooxidans]OLZ11947.1 sulfur reduction protein DsrE [Sulfobacillus thermosulfidooxidans]OLZ17630.1 sulfur reduction protein DsrE [Sulfobacillus thermosulfidooxidans]OLZ22411.1 sulfur reduction protein DsrE [Sulfobacillus thermosulfidooxidans]PSR28762.1 MAG: sulfur reduction protein DsrE [Sulfobacillus thermosulfidooxidans]
MSTKKILYIQTSGPDTPERTASPFFLATAACLLDHEVTMLFTMRGTQLMKKGVAENLYVKEGGETLQYFIDQALDAGVKFLVCTPSLDLNDMTKDDLIDSVSAIVGGTFVNEEALASDLVLSF